MVRQRERGAGNIGCVLGLVLLAAAVVVLVKAVPIMVAVGELTDFAEDQAQMASLPRHDDKLITERLALKAQELNLPLSEEHIKVSRDSHMVHVSLKFTVPIVVPFYTYQWHVVREFDRPLF